MRPLKSSFAGLLLIVVAMVCARTAQSDDFLAETTAWRAARVAELTDYSGWLTLVGLYWFKEGSNTFGDASSNAVVLDNSQLGKRAGTFVRQGNSVHFKGAKDTCVKANGAAVIDLELKSDVGGEPTQLSCGSLRFYVIQRGDQVGLRVKDILSPARRAFRGLDFFEAAESWNVNARFEPYQPMRHIPIVNVLGMQTDMDSPGAIVFERDGATWRLDTVLEEPQANELFIMFADGTSGRQTYGGGRFLYVPLPVDGRVQVDFNKAHNPPCAFTPFATCPLPPLGNRISLPITAGELKYAGHDH
jgi:hypothetical protein